MQGRLPGLLTTRAGNDPNGIFDAQIRGLTTFGNPNPLYIVDGIPMERLDALHPADIASVEIRPAGETFWTGLRGGNGVLEIKTHRGKPGRLRVNYRHWSALESMAGDVGMMNADQFLRAGGMPATDGAIDTDWWEEITRSAYSATHQLSLSGGNAQTSFYASANFDQVEGIVRKSGFDRLNGRLQIDQKAFNDRLRMGVGVALQTRHSTLSPYYAFQQATQYNPTAPIFGEGEAFEQYGGYYQALFFDNYSPVAVIDQNDFDRTYRNLLAHLDLDLRLSKHLYVRGQFSDQSERRVLRSFFPGSSFYIGMNRNGLAAQQRSSLDTRFGRLALEYERRTGDWDIRLAARGYDQQLTWTGLYIEASDFLTDAFTYNNLGVAESTANGDSFVDNSRIVQSLRGVGVQGRLHYQQRFGLALTTNYEGASHLGANQRWDLYYGVNAFAQVHEQIRLRASYSRTGNVPDEGLLAQGIYGVRGNSKIGNPAPGAYLPLIEKIQEENPDLRSERVRQFTAGFDFSLWESRLTGTVNVYQNQADRIILEQTPRYRAIAFPQYLNTGALSNSGLEFRFDYDLLRRENFSWQLGLSGARYAPTRIKAYFSEDPEDGIHRGVFRWGWRYPHYKVFPGENVGSVWGFAFLNDRLVNAQGEWNFKDLNQDGYLDPADFLEIGRTTPSLQLGISNRLRKGRWTLEFLLRGIFGHDIVNQVKSQYSTPITVGPYNGWLEGFRELRNLEDYPYLSERDVESGSFLRLDYLALQYDFPVKGLGEMSLFLAAQNLFTLSGYDGLNPDYRLVDRNWSNPFSDGLGSFYGYAPDPLVPGMDRTNSYPLSRTFSVGLQLSME